MLTISKPLSSGQAQTYHAKEFMSAEQNYWKQGDAILGEWQGRMAESYGLAGAIDSQHFARLSEGQPTFGRTTCAPSDRAGVHDGRWNHRQACGAQGRLGRYVLSSQISFSDCTCRR